jgi:hypothetical protein
MTQIVTVSASTAAYATEGLKPSARVNGSTHTSEAVHAEIQEVRRADAVQHAHMRDVVGAASITAFFVGAGERGAQLAQTTLREALEAYSFGKEEVEETKARDGDRDLEQQAQDHDEGEDQPKEEDEPDVLALPSPELLQSIDE